MKKIGKIPGALIVWASAYVNVIVFALCGGYFFLKSDDESLKNETKKALIVTLIFVGIGMIQSLVSYLFTLCGVSYSGDLYRAHQTIGTLVSVAKIAVYAVFAALSVFGGKKGEEKSEKPDDSTENDTQENNGQND
ncbi:MAG: hypothetical protein ACLTKZ_05995 [Lachnospiraceae bacterium]